MSLKKDHYFRVLKNSVGKHFSSERTQYNSSQKEIISEEKNFSEEKLESLLFDISSSFKKENFNIYFHTISKSRQNRAELINLVSGSEKYNITITADTDEKGTRYKISLFLDF